MTKKKIEKEEDFPQTVYVTKEPMGETEEGNLVYRFDTAKDPAEIAEVGSEIIVATYQLVDVNIVTAAVDMKPFDGKARNN